MMTVTPTTVTRHELAGLPVQVVAATCESRVGVAGVVRRETTNTLEIESPDGLTQVPKAGATFRFALTDEAAGARVAPGSASERPFDTVASVGPTDQSEGFASEEAATQDGERHDVVYVTVDGVRLDGRPVERTAQEADSLWR